MSRGAVKRSILAALLAGCAALSGCASLLERSYSMVEPYADRYWDSGEEDILRVDSYQDLVNSLVMLIEQKAEEAVIRCYGDVGSYQQASRARNEVRWETMKGAYLLENIQFTFEEGVNYGTAAFQMTYREDAEDLSSVMTLTDSQSLVDLLRLAVREEHEKITAQFSFETPRETVRAAVESYWQELCREEMEAEAAAAEAVMAEAALLTEPESSGEEEEPAEGPDEEDPEAGPEEPDAEPPEAGEAENGEPPETGRELIEPVSGTPEDEEPEPIDYPPCPWVLRFYPNQGAVELVEILLQTP